MTLPVTNASDQARRYWMHSKDIDAFDTQGPQFEPPPTPQVPSDQEATQLRPWIAPPTPPLQLNHDTTDDPGGQKVVAPPTPPLPLNHGTPDGSGGQHAVPPPTPPLQLNHGTTDGSGGQHAVPPPTPSLEQNRDVTDRLSAWLKAAPTPPVGGSGTPTESLNALLANVLKTSKPG